MQYAWLLWSLLLLIVWGAVYASLQSKKRQKEMRMVSLWTSLLGLTEPIFVPAYWNPPSLFDLAARTGFDIESLLFAFGIGGLALVIYERIFHVTYKPIHAKERRLPHHAFHWLALTCAPMLFVILLFSTTLNPIYSAIIALIGGGLATWACRPDLKRKMFVSACLFTMLYFVYFLTLIIAYPGYVPLVWNLPALSGILIVGIPLEELLFAFSFGFFWSSIYEHLRWRMIHDASRG